MRVDAPRRAVGAALLFLLAAFLAGVNPLPEGFSYHTFGVSEGILAILLTYVMLEREVWWSPAGVLRWVAVAYGTVASAQILGLLIPAPGVLEWMVLTGLAFSSWAIVGSASRTRFLGALGAMTLLLSILKFSVIPILWERAGPGPGEAWGLGDLAEGFRRLVVDHEPVTAAGQLLGFTAIALWAGATRVLWAQERTLERKDFR